MSRDVYGLHPDLATRIIDVIACPKCGAERYWPCTPLRETGHPTCLRPHRERAWVAAGGSLPMPKAGPEASPTMSPAGVKYRLTGNTVAQRTEADQFGAFVRRVIRAYARRVGDRDIDALTGLAALRDEVDQAMRDAVAGLHGNPYSWTDIGRALGITRQAAQARFADTTRPGV